MRKLLVLVAAGALTLGLAGTASAQSKAQGLAIVPFAAFNVPGVLASESDFLEFKPKAAPFVGLQLELGLSKAMSFGVGGGITMSQSLNVNDLSSAGVGNVGTADISSPRVYGVLSIRPAGRRPNGAVTPLAIEIGGGVAFWRFDKFIVESQVITPIKEWNGTEPFAFAGVAYNMPIGPRASIQLFARALGGFGYKSTGLDTFNASEPVTNVKGKFNVGLLVGAGIRVGR
jgi:hypothetical protein